VQAIISGVPQDQIQFVRSLLFEPLGTPIADGNRRAAKMSVYLAVLLGGVRGFLSLATTNGHTRHGQEVRLGRPCERSRHRRASPADSVCRLLV